MINLKKTFSNTIFIVIIALLLIPQTRKPIQIFLQKGISYIKPIQINNNSEQKITNFNWSLIDEHNKIYRFENVKGKIVFINFWATWCPPCIAEMPSLQALYNDYNDKVVFLFISNDTYKDINAFLNKNNYIFKVYRPASQYPDYFNITTIPRTFLIDRNGDIIIDENGVANWNGKKVRATLDALLK